MPGDGASCSQKAAEAQLTIDLAGLHVVHACGRTDIESDRASDRGT